MTQPPCGIFKIQYFSSKVRRSQFLSLPPVQPFRGTELSPGGHEPREWEVPAVGLLGDRTETGKDCEKPSNCKIMGQESSAPQACAQGRETAVFLLSRASACQVRSRCGQRATTGHGESISHRSKGARWLSSPGGIQTPGCSDIVLCLGRCWRICCTSKATRVRVCPCISGQFWPIASCFHGWCKSLDFIFLQISHLYNERMRSFCPSESTFRSVPEKPCKNWVLLLLVAKGHSVSRQRLRNSVVTAANPWPKSLTLKEWSGGWIGKFYAGDVIQELY